MTKFVFFLTMAAVITVFGSSCINNNNDTTNPQQGAFLLANVSPDAPALNVTLNSSAFGSGLSYGIYTFYYPQTAGSYTFTFTDVNNNTVLTKTATLSPNTYYSYFIIDSFKNVKSAFVQDNLILPGVDSSYIRFFNFSPNAGSLNFKDSVNATNLYTTRSFNDQESNTSYAAFTRKLAGIYTFQLTNPDGSVVASRKDTLSGGHIYTYFAKGFLNGTGTQAIGIGKLPNY